MLLNCKQTLAVVSVVGVTKLTIFISHFIKKASIDYFNEQKQLKRLGEDLQRENVFLSKDTIDNWYKHFVEWTNTTAPQYVNPSSKYIIITSFMAAMHG